MNGIAPIPYLDHSSEEITMLMTCLRIEGKDFNARAAARKLGLGRESYCMKGEVIAIGPRKGRKHRVSHLVIPLCDNDDMTEHMAAIEEDLECLVDFLAEQRRKSKSPLEIYFSTGIGVGGEKAFARGVYVPVSLMAKAAAFGISFQLNAYPCSDD